MSKKDGDDVSLESGYGSDNESNEGLAAPNKVSGVAAGMISNINALIDRLDDYDKYNQAYNKTTYAGEMLALNEAFTSVIENLGAELFHENLSDDKMQQFVDAVALNSESCFKFINDNQELDELKFKVARTEGTLKGFVLPINNGKITSFGLIEEEYEIPMKATKKAMLELQGKKITKAEYADKVVAKTMEILKQDEKNFSTEKLQQFENFVRQGNVSLKVEKDQFIVRENRLSKISQFDQNEISKAAIKSVDAFIKKLDIETERANSTSLEHGKEIVPQKSMPQHDKSQIVGLHIGEQQTKDLQAAKEMVSSIIDVSIEQFKLKIPTKTVEKIKKNLSPVLGKFDPQFLQENKTAIITNITDEITQGKTIFSKLRKETHIANDEVKKIAQKITKEYTGQNNQFIEEKINSLLNVNKAELALRLSTFIQESPILPVTITNILQLSEENKITGDNKITKLNRPTSGTYYSQATEGIKAI